MRQRLVAISILVALTVAPLCGCRSEAPSGPAVPAPTAPTTKLTAQWPATFTDAEKVAVTLSKPAQRIVSLAPAITEILFAIGAGKQQVGRTTYCDYPPEAKALPSVGSFTGFSVEKVLTLKPDLAVGTRGVSKDSFASLRSAGVPVLAFDPISVADVLSLMDTLAKITGVHSGAAAALQARVDAVSAQAAALPRHPRVLCAVQIDPLFVAGPRNHIDDMIRLAGGQNAAGDAQTEWPQYSVERMLKNDPEVIVVPRGFRMGNEGTDQGTAAKTIRASAAWKNTTAVKRNAILEIEDDLLTLPGPRLVDGLELMAKAVSTAAHPPSR